MFFELHDEKRIGYKELSDADLGRKATTNQTHIGLFDDVLTFLPNKTVVSDAMVIYDEKAKTVPLYFDRIMNPDGTYRSPKIRAGRKRNEMSVLSFIRSTVKNVASSGTWYLFWFGLKSKQPVFLIFNKESQIYADLCEFGVEFYPEIRSRLDPSHPAFQRMIKYLEYVVNISGITFAEALEVMADTGKTMAPQIRTYDIKKAYARFEKVGRDGEKLVDLFFKDQKHQGIISAYEWVNRDQETGLPYDFWFESLDGKCIYLDVKTTDYRFEQKMIFSSQEIEFATQHENDYCVYRVYCDIYGRKYLRICTDQNGLFAQINAKTGAFKSDLIDLATVQNVKLVLSPCHDAFSATGPIPLHKNSEEFYGVK